MPNYTKYQKSISDELIATKDRVRNFIDAAHWAEDGRYKEIILKDILANKLPAFASIGTGFVMGDRLSSQIDIIIYRSDIPVLFQKADFVIVSKEAVLGIIEVKTKLDDSIIDDTFKKAHDNGQIIGRHIFNGIFSYDAGYSMNILHTPIDRVCKEYPGYVNNVSFGKDYFMKYWQDGSPRGEPGEKYRIYKIENLSFGYFISNLIEDIYNQYQHARLPDALLRVMYPIENTKEAHKKYNINL